MIPRPRVSSRRILKTALALLLIGSGVLPGQTPDARLTLEDAIARALTENLGLRIDRLDTVVSAAAVEQNAAAFDTALFGNTSWGESDFENAGTPQPVFDNDGNVIDTVTVPTRSDGRSYGAGARKRLRLTNAAVQIQTQLRRDAGSSFDTELGQFIGGSLRERADLSVSVSQPLLQGFGRAIAEAPLERARAADRATQLQLRNAALEVIESTETAYWDLASAEARLEVRRSNRQLAENLLEELRERGRLGLATRLEVIQAEANLAQREDDIIVAEQTVNESSDALLVLIGGLQDAGGLTRGSLSVEALPDTSATLPSIRDVWTEGLRSDYRVAAQDEVIRQREIDLRLAADEKKPQVDLTVSGSFGGNSDEDASEAYDLLFEGDGKSWGVQLGFSMPLGRRAAIAGLRSAEARLEQAEWQQLQLKQSLLRSIRSAWRELESRQKRLATAQLVQQLQEETFAQERSRLDEGLSTLRDVLEIQADLDAARVALLDARVTAVQAEVRLERLRGTLLERHRLSWDAVAPLTVP